MTKTTLEEKIIEIIGAWIPRQIIKDHLLVLFASELKAKKKRWIEKVRMKKMEKKEVCGNCLMEGNWSLEPDLTIWCKWCGKTTWLFDKSLIYNQAISELNEKLTKLEGEKCLE